MRSHVFYNRGYPCRFRLSLTNGIVYDAILNCRYEGESTCLKSQETQAVRQSRQHKMIPAAKANVDIPGSGWSSSLRLSQSSLLPCG